MLSGESLEQKGDFLTDGYLPDMQSKSMIKLASLSSRPSNIHPASSIYCSDPALYLGLEHTSDFIISYEWGRYLVYVSYEPIQIF